MRSVERRLAAERGIRGAHDRRGRQLADGDVVDMAVGAIRTEGNHHMRLDAAEMAGDLLDRGGRIDGVERAVGIIEKRDVAETELFGGGEELGFARPADDLGARRFATVAEAAAFASGRRHQVGLDAVGGVLGQRPSGPERLVVGMRQHTHETKRHVSNLAGPRADGFAGSGHFPTRGGNGPNGPWSDPKV